MRVGEKLDSRVLTVLSPLFLQAKDKATIDCLTELQCDQRKTELL